jgi:hypothetical protein
MISIRVCEALVGYMHPQDYRLDHSGTLTVREVVRRFGRPEWTAETELLTTINGAEVTEDTAIQDGDFVVVAPRTGYSVYTIAVTYGILYAVAYVAAVVAVALLIHALVARNPRKPERGDISSPTYAYDGISTGIGPGFRVPLVFGEHIVGGQAVSISVASGLATGQASSSELLDVLLCLSEGRCESIGDSSNRVTGGLSGEDDDLGTLGSPSGTGGTVPGGIKVNGIALNTGSSRMAIRMGELNQNPMTEFSRAVTTIAVGLDMTAVGISIVQAIDVTEIDFFTVRLVFPNGLYEFVGTTGATSGLTTTWRIEYRQQGTSIWAFAGDETIAENARNRFAVDLRYRSNLTGPLEVRVTHLLTQWQAPTQQLGSAVVTWEHLLHETSGPYAHPRRCLLGVRLRANEQINGGVINITVPMRGIRCRVYDATLGGLSADRYWELPPTGDTYAGIWSYPPGQNPAWIMGELLTAEWSPLSTMDWELDWANLRDWADNNDSDTDDGLGGSEALCQFDGVFDQGTSAWDAVLRVCAAGRAMPVIEGNHFRVKYEYAAAHGRGTNSVPARARSALLLSSNTALDVQVTYRDPSTAPNVLEVQILNRDLNYEQDIVSIEDSELPDLNLPYKLNAPRHRKETLTLYGVTRPSQARREGFYAMELERRALSTITATAGIEHLAVQVGDVVGYQTDIVRPHATQGYGYRSQVGGTLTGGAGSGVKIDHDYDASSGTHELLVVDTAGVLQERTVTAGSYSAGDEIQFTGGSITIAKSAPVAIGKVDAVVQDYVVSSVTIQGDGDSEGLRQISGVEWQPDALTPPAADVLAGSATDATTILGTTDTVPAPSGIQVARSGTSHAVRWAPPDNYAGRPARVWGRRSGGAWRLIGEGAGYEVAAEQLEPHSTYEIAVATQDRDNLSYHDPETIAATSITVPEFSATPPAPVANLSASVLSDGVLLQWDPVDSGARDYEIRAGTQWLGARIVGRSMVPELTDTAPVYGTQTYMVRARGTDGLYSGTMTTVTANYTGPTGGTVNATATDLSGSAAGTHSNTQWDATLDAVILADGAYAGTYTSTILTATATARLWWSALVDYGWVDDTTTVGELTFEVGSGEGHWWLLDGRAPSLWLPGYDLATLVSDHTEAVGLMAGPVHGAAGTVGAHAEVVVQARYDTTGAGAWTDWGPLRPQRIEARKFQARAHLRRRTLGYEPQLRSVEYAAIF